MLRFRPASLEWSGIIRPHTYQQETLCMGPPSRCPPGCWTGSCSLYSGCDRGVWRGKASWLLCVCSASNQVVFSRVYMCQSFAPAPGLDAAVPSMNRQIAPSRAILLRFVITSEAFQQESKHRSRLLAWKPDGSSPLLQVLLKSIDINSPSRRKGSLVARDRRSVSILGLTQRIALERQGFIRCCCLCLHLNAFGCYSARNHYRSSHCWVVRRLHVRQVMINRHWTKLD